MESRAIWEGPSLVIDTDTYSGSFERGLCAYLTGLHNEISSAEAPEMAELFKNEVGDPSPFEDLFGMGYEFYGGCEFVAVPVTVYPTPGWSNECGIFYQVTDERPFVDPANMSVRLFLTQEPTTEELDVLKARAETFSKTSNEDHEPFKITGYRIVYEKILVEGRSV